MKIERIETKSDVSRVVRESGGMPQLEKDLWRYLEQSIEDGYGVYVRYTSNFLQRIRVLKGLLDHPDIEFIMNQTSTWEFEDTKILKNWVEIKPKAPPVTQVFQYVIKTGELSLWHGRQFRLEKTAADYMDDFIFFYGNISMDGIE